MNIAQMHADGRSARIAELEAEVAALRRDRERLEYLANQKWFRQALDMNMDWAVGDKWHEPLDKAIDAARAAETAAA